jgi:lipase
VQLNAYSWGDESSPPVVCLHGITGHGQRFRKLAEERLADRYRVVSIDLRGHGSSGWEPPWTVEAHIADVLETADAHGIDRAVWMGHSFGGRLAAEIVARAPERAAGSVLLDPALYVDPETALEYADSYRADASFGSPEEAIDAKLATGSYFSTPQEIWDEEAEQHLERGEDARYRWRFSPLATICAFGEMSIRAPVPLADVLVVIGKRSWLPVELPQLGSIEVVAVSGGHSVLWDDFDATATAIRRFLDSQWQP